MTDSSIAELDHNVIKIPRSDRYYYEMVQNTAARLETRLGHLEDRET